MPDSDLLDQIEAMGADTVYFIKRGDGLWGVHVRHPGAGPCAYTLTNCRTLRGAVQAAVEPSDTEIEDLL